MDKEINARRYGGPGGRAMAAVVILSLAIVVSACGKTDSKASAPSETTDAKGASTCPTGSFGAQFTGVPAGFKLTGTGNPPGWYVWLTGTMLHVRLASDPAKPLVPAPATSTTEPPKPGSTNPPPAVTITYDGEVKASAMLGKVTTAPDNSAGSVEGKDNNVTFALNGQAKPVGFEVPVPCAVKKLQVKLLVPGAGTGQPAAVDKIFIGAKGHPLTNPIVMQRTGGSDGGTTDTTTAKPKASTPTTKAGASTTTAKP
jgi:hypothetical protein